jgi:hypothetical protein
VQLALFGQGDGTVRVYDMRDTEHGPLVGGLAQSLGGMDISPDEKLSSSSLRKNLATV